MPPKISTLFPSCRLRQARTFHSSAALAFIQTTGNNEEPRAYIGVILNEEPNSIALRSKGKFLQSPAEAMALIRAVERTYGSVREFRFMRDQEAPLMYQYFVNVAFRDPMAIQRVSASPSSLTFDLPRTIPDRPGGIGLDELEPFLQVEEFSETSKLPSFGSVMQNVNDAGNETETVTYTVTRTNSPWYAPSGMRPVRTSRAVAQSFLQWGGFSQLKPISTKTRIDMAELFRPSNVDSPRMRCALRNHSIMLGVSDPNVTPRTTGPPPDWEPLPGHETTLTDTPMPSVIQAVTNLVEHQPPSPPTVPNAASATPTTLKHTIISQSTTSEVTTIPGAHVAATEVPAYGSSPSALPLAAASTTPVSKTSQSAPQKKKKQKKKTEQVKASGKQHVEVQREPHAQKEETTQTVKEKLSKFFSSIF